MTDTCHVTHVFVFNVQAHEASTRSRSPVATVAGVSPVVAVATVPRGVMAGGGLSDGRCLCRADG